MKSFIFLSWVTTGSFLVYGMGVWAPQLLIVLAYVHGALAATFLLLHFRMVFSFCDSCGEYSITDLDKVCGVCRGTGNHV